MKNATQKPENMLQSVGILVTEKSMKNLWWGSQHPSSDLKPVSSELNSRNLLLTHLA